MKEIRLKLPDLFEVDPQNAERPNDLAAITAYVLKHYAFLPKSIAVTVEGDEVVISYPEEADTKREEAARLAERAVKRASEGQYDKAIGIYKRVLELQPSLHAARRDLAMAYMELGDVENAINHLIEVLRLDPKDAWSWVVLGNLYIREKHDLETGEKFLRKALEIKPLAVDLTGRFGRGFSRQNLQQMRQFYQAFGPEQICQTVSGKFSPGQISQTASGQSVRRDTGPKNYATLSRKLPGVSINDLAARFPLPWSAYVRLLSLTSEQARRFYETEALRGGWSVRQLDRQINALFYERTALSRNKAEMLTKGAAAKREDAITPEEEIKNPYVLEFLGLKDEYSESDIEEALILHLEHFLLELGGDFAFIGRQRRLRIGDEWYRVDLLFFHRKLRCLVVIDLKRGRFTHGDAGQMHMYLNYARKHWIREGENPPVGLILCSQRDEAIAHYALEGLPNKILATEYRTVLPDEKLIADEIEKTRRQLETRQRLR